LLDIILLGGRPSQEEVMYGVWRLDDEWTMLMRNGTFVLGNGRFRL
jgi:hypothetical protein